MISYYLSTIIFNNSRLFALQNYFPISINSIWTVAAFVMAFVVIGVAAIVYALSGILNSSRAKGWARFQIYEALLSIILILIFLAFYTFFTTNPQGAFGPSPGLGVVPVKCTSAQTIFTLASCDLSQFQLVSLKVTDYFFLFGAFSSFEPGFKVGGSVAYGTISLQTTVPSIFPVSILSGTETVFLFFLTLLIFNEFQLFVISAAPLIFSLLIVIGLLARTTGFARRFGGTMIAFAIGIGLLYPLLVSITYGFIMVHISSLIGISISSIMSFIGNAIFSGLGSLAGYATFPVFLNNAFTVLTYLIAGMTFIPILNLIILEAFILDFSTAMGERMSFMGVFQHGLI